MLLGLWCLTPLSTIIQLYMAVSFIVHSQIALPKLNENIWSGMLVSDILSRNASQLLELN
jgi:hypothetical protein